MNKQKLTRTFFWILAGCFVLLGIIQLVPYGKEHNNPPVTSEPSWDSPETRQLVKNACFNCHSNETEYPWYSKVAPMSWLLQRDFDQGRAVLNFSEWETSSLSGSYIIRIVEEGKMPPFQYTLMHPETKLQDEQFDMFIKGIKATLGD